MPAPILPPRDLVAPETPLRLDVAAAIAYPDGSMSAAILRAEAAHGRLDIERVGRRYYTTLRAIEEMRERCRVKVKAPDFGCGRPGEVPAGGSRTPPAGSSGTGAGKSAQAAAKTALRMLRDSSPSTSPPST